MITGPSKEQLQRDLIDQAAYSGHVLEQYEGLLNEVRRVDQKYGPFPEFARWRDSDPTTPEAEK